MAGREKTTPIHGMRGLVFALALLAAATVAQSAPNTGPQLGAKAQSAATASSQRPWRRIQGSAANTAGATFIASAGASQPVSLAVALKLRDKDALESYIAAQHTPGNPLYHQWLSNEQSTEMFGPTTEQTHAVADYLTQSGFTNVRVAANRLLVSADGTIALAEQAFNTKVDVYTRDGETGFANTSEIQVPDELPQIEHVLGLDTVNAMRVHSMPVRPVSMPAASGAKGANGTVSSDPSDAVNPMMSGGHFYPDEYRTVYNTGASKAIGTDVAIIGWGSMVNSQTDLKQMVAARGLSAVTTSIVSVDGNSTNDCAQGEWAMDAQAIAGISGGVKSLTFYTTSNIVSTCGGSSAGILAAINLAVTDNKAKVINMSFGSACSSGATYFDNAFKVGITQGQTFVASSGDNGSYDCPSGAKNGSWSTSLGVSYPSYSPYVISIGGTTVTTQSKTNPAYVSESAWPYGGGGISNVAKPSWQSSLTNSSYRQVPDLAFDADWTNSGMIMYLTANGAAGGITSTGWYYGGGTSLSAPLFAGVWAILQSANGNNLGFAAPAIYNKITALQQNGALHDVTAGKNGPNATYYSAKVGYDNATGWGSLNVAKALTVFPAPVTTYIVTPTVSGGNGTISPSTPVTVNANATTMFTLTPNTGYQISSVSGCNGALDTATGVYTTGAITANCTVTAAFAIKTYTVTASVSGSNGSISPASRTVNHGSTTTFTVTPDTGYTASATGCNGSLNTATGVYATGAITANCTVTAAFAIKTYTVTASVSGGNGSISPASRTVNHGSTTTFTVTPDTGYTASATGCNGSLNTATGVYTTGAITANCSVAATFTAVAPKTFTITPSASGNGTISPSTPVTVNAGATYQFTVTPSAGYAATMGGTCGGTLAGNVYKTNAINANCTVTAAFAASAPTFKQAVSRMVHGAAGTFDLPISASGSLTAGTAITVEPRVSRASNAFDVVFQFSSGVTSATATSTAGTATVGAVSGTEVTVHLTGVPDMTRVRVALPIVNGVANTASVNIGFLYGDVDGNRFTQTTDSTRVRARAAQTVNATNFMYDVDANGFIQTTDDTIVRARSANFLP